MSAIVCPTSRCFYILRTEPLIFHTNKRPSSLGEIFKLPQGCGGRTYLSFEYGFDSNTGNEVEPDDVKSLQHQQQPI